MTVDRPESYNRHSAQIQGLSLRLFDSLLLPIYGCYAGDFVLDWLLILFYGFCAVVFALDWLMILFIGVVLAIDRHMILLICNQTVYVFERHKI
ncbi:hypothetical protein ACR8KM_22470, partial [Salmonella enterica subsp. enterica serovar Paratyphi A]